MPKPYTLTLEINSLPKSLNKALRSNRWKLHAQNKGWDLLVFGMCRGKLPPKPLVKARIKITREFYRTLDYDGLVGSLKPVVDALVSAGVLIDDSWKTLGVWDVTQSFRPKKLGPRLLIEVADVVDE